MVEVRHIAVENKNFYESESSPYLQGNPIFPITFFDLKNNFKIANYIAFDGLGIDLENDNQKFLQNEFTGFLSSETSNSNLELPYSTEIQFTIPDAYPKGITICFYGDCCKELLIEYYMGTEIINSYYKAVENPNVYIPIEAFIEKNNELLKATELHIKVTKTVIPNQSIKIQSIIIGQINYLNKFKNLELLEEINVLSNDLPINSFDFSVITDEKIDFQKDDPLNLYSNGKYYGTFFLEDLERVSENTYSIKSLNNIKIFDEIQYKEYSSAKSNEVFNEISKLTNTSIILPTNDMYYIFGNIPINSCRYALCLSAFACGFMIDNSRSSSIYLKKIPKEITSVITSKNKRIIGNATYTKSKAITLAKMQYPVNIVKETEIIKIENNPNERITYYFEHPVELSNKQPEGVVVYSNSDNYVTFISPTKSTQLSGNKLNYFYNNIQISNNSENTSTSNEFDLSKLNLEGIKNENGNFLSLVDEKIKDIIKYIQSKGIIKAKIRLRGEKVGDLIQIETAYDGIKTGIITSMNIHFGYEDTADIEVLEWEIG